jgi:hypothetical protein
MPCASFGSGVSDNVVTTIAVGVGVDVTIVVGVRVGDIVGSANDVNCGIGVYEGAIRPTVSVLAEEICGAVPCGSLEQPDMKIRMNTKITVTIFLRFIILAPQMRITDLLRRCLIKTTKYQRTSDALKHSITINYI